jgi:ribonuclease BN (tRNA processing enzyme)
VRHVASGAWLLVDCPHPIHKILAEASAASGLCFPLPHLAGTLISHLHLDHCSGLEGLGYFIRYRINSPQAQLAESELPALVAGPRVAQTLAAHETERKVFQIRALEPGKVLELGPFQVEAHPTVHGDMPCYAFRVRDAASGRTISHSADTRLEPALIDWLAEGSDFIVHEIGSPIPGTRNHAEYGELLAYLRTRADFAELIRKLHLAHYGDEFDAAASDLPVLRQGRVYEV